MYCKLLAWSVYRHFENIHGLDNSRGNVTQHYEAMVWDPWDILLRKQKFQKSNALVEPLSCKNTHSRIAIVFLLIICKFGKTSHLLLQIISIKLIGQNSAVNKRPLHEASQNKPHKLYILIFRALCWGLL